MDQEFLDGMVVLVLNDNLMSGILIAQSSKVLSISSESYNIDQSRKTNLQLKLIEVFTEFVK
jgi:hypothetical protein